MQLKKLLEHFTEITIVNDNVTRGNLHIRKHVKHFYVMFNVYIHLLYEQYSIVSRSTWRPVFLVMRYPYAV